MIKNNFILPSEKGEEYEMLSVARALLLFPVEDEVSGRDSICVFYSTWSVLSSMTALTRF